MWWTIDQPTLDKYLGAGRAWLTRPPVLSSLVVRSRPRRRTCSTDSPTREVKEILVS
jgi:hypothetical protein